MAKVTNKKILRQMELNERLLGRQDMNKTEFMRFAKLDDERIEVIKKLINESLTDKERDILANRLNELSNIIQTDFEDPWGLFNLNVQIKEERAKKGINYDE